MSEPRGAGSGGRPFAKGQAATAPVPRGARLLDQSHSTVLPGLIDLHTHLVGDIQGSSPTAADALLGVAHARATLLAGFTTVRDVGTYRGGIEAHGA